MESDINNNNNFQGSHVPLHSQQMLNNRQYINIQNRIPLFSNSRIQQSQNMSMHQSEENRDVDMVDVINNPSTIVHTLNNDARHDHMEEAKELLLHYNQPLIDISLYAPYLTESDIENIKLFQSAFDEKIKLCFETIDNRRKEKIEQIEQHQMMLMSMGYINNPDLIHRINILQKISLRAMETETVALQKLRVKIADIVNDFKGHLEVYIRARRENHQIENFPLQHQSYLNRLDMNEFVMPFENTEPQLMPTNVYQSKTTTNDDQVLQQLFLRKSNNSTFPLHKLPSEILHLVLDKLTSKSEIVNLLTVCKLWALIIVKILYYRPHINKKSQLDLFLRTMKLDSKDTMFNYRLMIKRLNFSFVGDYLYDDYLYYFVGCFNLERLTLVFCKHITSRPVAAVLTGCKYLQSVDITGIKEIYDDVFLTLADSCKRVQGFYVPSAGNISFYALQMFTSSVPMLKRVKITSNTLMDDKLLEIMADKCPILVEVDITNSVNVTDKGLIKLFLKLNQLREFRITHNSKITDRVFLELVKKLQQLPALRLVDFSSCENITDRTIEKLVDLSPKLRNIFLGKCSRVTDASLFNLARLGKNLQTVHFGHCFNITDQGVRVLVQSCPRIQYVDFACCTNLTNRTLYELADLVKLKRIGLVKCSQMTDEGLLNMISLRGRNDGLERVHLSYCSNLTIYPIYELLMACPKLSHLSLTAVPSFLRPDITAFCRPAPHDFSENQRQIFCVFSGKGVHKLRHYLMSLTTPTNGPQTDIDEILAKYIVANNIIQQNENLETAINRVIHNLNQDSAAILAATGINQGSEISNDFTFQNIDFERLDDIFNAFNDQFFNSYSIIPEHIEHLQSKIDRRFIEDPFNESFEEREPVVVPHGSREINSEMYHIVRKFHEIDERIDDFEVNVASLARVQFQFTGFLLHEMTQLYLQMIELNRQLSEVQNRVKISNNEKDIKGLFVWRMMFHNKFSKLLQKYKISTVVLRIYLKDSITFLTRQREWAIEMENMNFVNASNNNNVTENNNVTDDIRQSPLLRQLVGRASLTPDQIRLIQRSILNPSNLRGGATTNQIRGIQENVNESQTDERSGTPVD
ncbi:SCF ubiquitin ligase complex subunit GRR1 PWA37_003641 [Arxiozyma heterogenica]|uniref:SCF ubiquitin ligase complex subunit GRR1 n=1 Tax=Arxiozyma heterogenica TaxID=278026 RepID=UPI002F1B78F0